MSDRIKLWFDVITNNGWQPENCIGNVMLLVIMTFIIVNVWKNKKLNLMQLSGNLLLLTLCFLIIVVRR